MESRGKLLKNKTNQLCVSALENSALKIESKKMTEEQQAPTLGAFWGAGMFTLRWGIPGRLPHLPGVRHLHVNRPLGGRRVETGQYLLLTIFVVVGKYKTMCTIQLPPKFHLLCLW